MVLVVYNQLALTRACLESLRGHPWPFELCVVDNASTDGTEAFFRDGRARRARCATTATPTTWG